MPNRKTMPERRPAWTRKIEYKTWSGQTFHYLMSVGRFEDGTIGEVFLDTNKAGTDAQALASDAAIIFSIARQYGVPIPVLREGMSRNGDGTPQSLLGAVMDAIVEEMTPERTAEALVQIEILKKQREQHGKEE